MARQGGPGRGKTRRRRRSFEQAGRGLVWHGEARYGLAWQGVVRQGEEKQQ